MIDAVNEAVWLTKKGMAKVFDVAIPTETSVII